MPVCLGSYAVGEQIGVMGGPNAAQLTVPVPKVTSLTGPCVSGEISLYTSQEVDSNSGNPFRMSVEDGVQLSAGISAIWLAAAVWRWMAAALRQDADSST